jgi:hypothetical protein
MQQISSLSPGLLCPICRQVLLGMISYDFWGNKFCYRHINEYPYCFSCSRLVTAGLTQGGFTYPDGRVICNICRKTEVVRPEKARIVADRVKTELEKWGICLGKFTVPLRFVQQYELDLIHHTHSTQKPTGITRASLLYSGNNIIRKSVDDILILFGLPEEHTASVLAHELGHAWLILKHYPQLDEMTEEGLCELIDYFWLSSLNTLESKFRIELKRKNQDPIYGLGFQKAYNSYKKLGLSELLKYLQQYHRYPL